MIGWNNVVYATRIVLAGLRTPVNTGLKDAQKGTSLDRVYFKGLPNVRVPSTSYPVVTQDIPIPVNVIFINPIFGVRSYPLTIMFAKVANRVRSRSAGQKLSTPLPVQQHEQPEPAVQVDIAPELLRWSDFSTPFPSVSMGGYSRFYEMHTISEQTEPLSFCPLLSQHPEPSPSSEIPPKSLLFDTPRPLPMIREASLESLSLNKARNLTITTDAKISRPLKRRHRRLLRTPSIERDFIQVKRQSSLDTPVSIEAFPTDNRSSFSSDSRLSNERSEYSNHSESPITPSTPSTSFEHEDVVVMFSTDKLSSSPHNESESESVTIASPTSPASWCTVKPHRGQHHESESMVTRPLSSISYCSARSDFGEI